VAREYLSKEPLAPKLLLKNGWVGKKKRKKTGSEMQGNDLYLPFWHDFSFTADNGPEGGTELEMTN